MNARWKRRNKTLAIGFTEEEVQFLLGAIRAHESWATRPAILGDGSVDPAYQRLFPRAYLDPTEDAAESNWQLQVHSELARSRSDALEQFRSQLETSLPQRKGTHDFELPPETIEQWSVVINEIRIRLGVELDVTEDRDWSELDPAHPHWDGSVTYLFLSELLEVLVSVLDT